MLSPREMKMKILHDMTRRRPARSAMLCWQSCSVAALLLMGVALLVPARAAQVVFEDYYEDSAFVSCASESCHLDFSAVPQNTLITKVNCVVRGNEALREIRFGVKKPAGLLRYEYLPVPAPAIAGGTQWYSILAPTDFLFGAGAIPSIHSVLISDATGGLLDCKITGRFWPT
jgi:hypothetical protein